MKFPPAEYAVLEEVRNATGFGASRSADALVMSLWPSRGLELWGIEIKESRSDWLREKKNPKKAETIAAYCDRWFICAPKGIVQPDELPPAWGLIEPGKGGTLRVTKQAERTEAKTCDRSFLAAMLRRAQETGASAEQIKAAREQAAKDVRQHAARDLDWQKREAEDLRRAIQRFEEASGVKLDRYDGARIGEAVRLVLNRQHVNVRSQLERLATQARTIVASIEREIAAADAESSSPITPGSEPK